MVKAGVQYPELLRGPAWAEYQAVRADEERHYDALDRGRYEKLNAARGRGLVARLARQAARRVHVAGVLAEDPTANLAALARTLGVSLSSIYHDRRAIGALQPRTCPGCQRPL
jgi:hypothetical protein